MINLEEKKRKNNNNAVVVDQYFRTDSLAHVEQKQKEKRKFLALPNEN
jgi:hypothetical protein